MAGGGCSSGLEATARRWLAGGDGAVAAANEEGGSSEHEEEGRAGELDEEKGKEGSPRRR